MKRSIYTAIALAILALVPACKKDNPQKPDPIDPPVEDNRTAHFSFAPNECMGSKVMYTINNGQMTGVFNVTVPEGDKNAYAEVEVPEEFSSPFEFNFIAPINAVNKFNKENRTWVLDIPSTQEPSENAADMNAAIYSAWTDQMETIPEENMALEFRQITAGGKVDITNLSHSAGAISRLVLAFAPNVAGRYQYSKGTYTEKLGSSALTLSTSSASGVFFGCAPAELEGTDITVTVSAAGGDYTKTFPAGNSRLEAGKTTEFTFDFTGVPSSLDKIYSMVTSISDLKTGDEVIIVCTDNAKAVSNVQNAKNRGAADIILEEDGTIKNPAGNVQNLTISREQGKIAFYTGTAYLGPQEVTDNCYLQEIESLEDAWLTLDMDENGNTAMCRGAYTLKYYGKNNVFNMFVASTGKPVQLYKKNSSK